MSAATAPGTGPNRVIAFRADAEIMAMLDKMPNASDFIRRAIQKSLAEPCPVCEGRGVVAPTFRAEMERLGGHILLRRCDCCAGEFPAPCDGGGATALAGADRLRHLLAERRGEHLCAACFAREPACEACGRTWLDHDAEAFVDHFKLRHCGRALLTDIRLAPLRAAPGASTAEASADSARRPAARPKKA